MDGSDLLIDLGPLRVAGSDEERPAAPARRPSLATLLVEAGLVSAEQVNEALVEGRHTGERLGEVLIRRGWASEEDVARGLSDQSGLPFLSPGSCSVDPGARRVLPPAEARRLEACVVGFDGGTPVVALADPVAARLESLRQRLGEETVFAIVTSTTLADLLDGAPADELGIDVPSMVTAPDPPREIVEDAPPLVAAADRPEAAAGSETHTPAVDPRAMLPELDGLTAALRASAETVSLLRTRLERLVESSAETNRELEECRRQLRADELAREQDRETIRQLEEQLARRAKIVDDLKAKFGELVSGLEAAG